MQYDIIIIGAGPAGLSAAITLRARNKNVLVVGPVKQGEHAINNYLGLPDIAEGDLIERFLKHVKDAGAEHIENRATAVYAMGDTFSVQLANGEMLQAISVIIACGVNTEKAIDGEEDLLGQWVSYCATCDGMLYKGKNVAAIVYNDSAESDLQFLKEICATVEVINAQEEKPISLIKDADQNKLAKIHLETEIRELDFDGVFIFRDSIAPATLVPSIETEGRHIKVDKNFATNLPGCFACGDCIGKPYQIAKAVGEGNVAALNVVKYLTSRFAEPQSGA